MNSCLAFSAAERSVSERRRRGPGRKTEFCFLVLVRCYQDLTLCISCLVFLFASTEILRCELSTSMWCFAHASWRLNVRGHIGSGVYTCTHACNKPTSKTKAAPQSSAVKKVQGAELPFLVIYIYIDTPWQAAFGYSVLCCVRHARSYLRSGHITPTHFTPMTRR